MDLLVRTPVPFPTESLWGYVLRVSEENGYDTPRYMLQFAGLPIACNQTRFNAEVLTNVVGHDPSLLACLSYSGSLGKRAPKYMILGHSLGEHTSHHMLRLTNPAFCPHCVKESGYIDAMFDLSCIVACPVHKCLLIDRCPGCNEKLTRLRPGLLKCKCGGNLANASTPPAPEPVAELMAVLRNKLHRKPLSELVNSCGFPLEEMDAIPLWETCMMIISLAKHSIACDRGDNSHTSKRIGYGWVQLNLKTIVEHSANVLRNWPENYHLFLSRIGNATASAADNAIGLNTRFTSYYNSMFKHRKYVQALSFLRQEYVRFGCQFWGKNTVDDRTLRCESRRKRDKSKEGQPKISITYDKRWVSKAEMARRLGVTVDTIQQLAKDGLLPMKVVTVNRSKRYIIDTESVRVPARTDGTTLRYRAAASCVGLPADVLKALRESEHYKVSHLPSRRAAFHEKDVENFRLLLLQRTGLSSGERPSSEIAFSLAEVMKKLKFGSAKMKAKFVADYLDGHIAALGRFGDTTADIYFDKSMATAFSKSHRLDAGGPCSYEAAAKLIFCDAKAIPDLITQGYLTFEKGKLVSSLISRESIKSFSAQWVPLRTIAKSLGTSSVRLERLADNAGIQRLVARPTYKGANPSSFIRREDDQRLRAESQKHPARERKIKG